MQSTIILWADMSENKLFIIVIVTVIVISVADLINNIAALSSTNE